MIGNVSIRAQFVPPAGLVAHPARLAMARQFVLAVLLLWLHAGSGHLRQQLSGRRAESTHKSQDGEVARLYHCPGLDLPDRGDADASQGRQPLLGHAGVLTNFA